MGKRWRKYQVGRYSLGQLNGEAVVVWQDDERRRHRQRLGVFTEAEGRIAVDTFVSRIEALKRCDGITVGMIWVEYVEDRRRDGKLVEAFEANWKALEPRFGGMLVRYDRSRGQFARTLAGQPHAHRHGGALSTFPSLTDRWPNSVPHSRWRRLVCQC